MLLFFKKKIKIVTQNMTQTDSFTKQISAEYSYGIVVLLDYFFYY